LIPIAITSRTKAIMPVHQVGMPAPMKEIMEMSERHGLIVIEDAACALGSEYEGEKVGKPFGIVACFSFHPRKIITTGDGGMITTNDDELAARLRRLRQHAVSVSALDRHKSDRVMFETYDEIGYNYRMTDLQAAVGIEQLKRLPDVLRVRRALAARYTEAFSEVEWLQVPYVPRYANPNYQSYILRIGASAPMCRDALMAHLLRKGIATRRGIMCIHQEKAYRARQWSLPQSERATDTTITLPLYHGMTIDEQDYVISAILRVEVKG